jgi:hypothetical protein
MGGRDHRNPRGQEKHHPQNGDGGIREHRRINGLMAGQYLPSTRSVKIQREKITGFDQMKKSSLLMVLVSALLMAGVILAGCTTQDSGSTATQSGTSTGSPAGEAQASKTTNEAKSQASSVSGSSDQAAASGTPLSSTAMNGTRPSGTPPGGMTGNGTHPSGTPPEGMMGNGTHSGTPPSGTMPSGTPPSGP